MSQKRSADMAAIAARLEYAKLLPGNGMGTQDIADVNTFVGFKAEPFEPSGAAVELLAPAPSTATPEQKAAVADLLKGDQAAAKYQAEQLQLETQRQSLIKKQLSDTAKATQQAVGSLKNGIGSVSMPGGLAVPIITLLVLFLLLVQVNGNTRFGWLWLVLSGNAQLSGSPGGNTSGTVPPAEQNALNAVGNALTGGNPPPLTLAQQAALNDVGNALNGVSQ